MRCRECGNDNREGAKFCDSCGATLAEAPKAPACRVVPFGRPAGESRGRALPGGELPRPGRAKARLPGAVGAPTGARWPSPCSRPRASGRRSSSGPAARRQAMGKLGDHPHIVGDHRIRRGRRAGRSSSPSTCRAATCLAPRRRRGPPARGRARGRDRDRHLPRARARPRLRHRPPRPEARERLARRGRARPARRLRAGPTSEGRSRASVEGALVGTVAYLPPEQALGRASDAALGPLLARRPALRDADRPARPSRATTPSRSSRATPERGAGVRRRGVQRRGPAGARDARPRAARQAAERSAGERRRGPRASSSAIDAGRDRCPSAARPRTRRTRSTASPAASSSGASSELGELRAARRRGALAGRGGLIAARRRAGDRQDAHGGGARDLRQGARRAGSTGAAATRARARRRTGPGSRRSAPTSARPIRSASPGSSGPARAEIARIVPELREQRRPSIGEAGDARRRRRRRASASSTRSPAS